LPIKPLKSTALRRLMNNDNESAETTSSGKEFQTVTMRTAKKCCLQLTLDSGKTVLKNKSMSTGYTITNNGTLMSHVLTNTLNDKQYRMGQSHTPSSKS